MHTQEIIIGVVIGNFLSCIIKQSFFIHDVWGKLGRFSRPKLIEDENITEQYLCVTHARAIDDLGEINTFYVDNSIVEERRCNFIFTDTNGFLHKIPIDKCLIYSSDGMIYGSIYPKTHNNL